MKIGILGGTFDPIHNGHLAVAKAAKEQLGLDEVWLCPAGKTPLKDRKLTKKKHRLAMSEIAAKSEPWLKVTPIEMERKGKSYTVDTLAALKEQHPEDEFTWIIGNDQLAQFSKWKDADKLIEMADFAVTARDEMLNLDPRYPMKVVSLDPVDVSSTEIRNGNKLDMLPREVLDYIYNNNLYMDGFIGSRMNEHRYLHSLSVANLCRAMAETNGLDPQKAYIIGAYHDIAKCMPVKEQEKWMKRHAADHLSEPVPTWHGYVGAEIAREQFLLDDPEIYDAIRNHVYGSSTKPYAMIVYAADKLDPLRGYDSSSQIEACMENIDKGYDLVAAANRHYLKDRGVIK